MSAPERITVHVHRKSGWILEKQETIDAAADWSCNVEYVRADLAAGMPEAEWLWMAKSNLENYLHFIEDPRTPKQQKIDLWNDMIAHLSRRVSPVEQEPVAWVHKDDPNYMITQKYKEKLLRSEHDYDRDFQAPSFTIPLVTPPSVSPVDRDAIRNAAQRAHDERVLEYKQSQHRDEVRNAALQEAIERLIAVHDSLISAQLVDFCDAIRALKSGEKG